MQKVSVIQDRINSESAAPEKRIGMLAHVCIPSQVDMLAPGIQPDIWQLAL